MSEEPEHEQRVTPSAYVKDGITYHVLPNDHYVAMQQLTDVLGGHVMSESDYHRERETERQQYEAKRRDIRLQQEELKRLNLEQDLIDAVRGRRPIIYRRVVAPQSADEKEDVEGVIEDDGEDDDVEGDDGFDEDEFGDLEE